MKAFFKGRFLQLLAFAVILAVAVVGIFKSGVLEKFKRNTPLSGDILRVTYIDVGQGDSTYITFPDGENMLIDGGSNNSMAYDYLKGEKVSKIDYLVATHPHEDHIGGLAEICENTKTNKVYLPDVSASTKIYNRFLTALDKGNCDVNVAEEGVLIKETDNLRVEILSPVESEYDNLNNYSAVVKITYKDVSFLFTGDCEADAEELLDFSKVEADVLKVGHHGSKSSSSRDFINAVNPKYAVISVGENNSYGHPNDKVLERLADIEAKVYRTDVLGDICVTTNGTDINID